MPSRNVDTHSDAQLSPGAMPAGERDLGGAPWDVMGSSYWPKAHSDEMFVFETLDPPGTFVPPHLHAEQDETAYVLAGRYEVCIGEETLQLGPGDLARLPRGVAHSYACVGEDAGRMLFCASPAGGLAELFAAIDGVPDSATAVRLAADCGVTLFLGDPEVQ